MRDADADADGDADEGDGRTDGRTAIGCIVGFASESASSKSESGVVPTRGGVPRGARKNRSIDRSIGVSSWVAFTTIGIGIAVSATFKDDDDDDDDACRVVSRRVVRGYRDVV